MTSFHYMTCLKNMTCHNIRQKSNDEYFSQSKQFENFKSTMTARCLVHGIEIEESSSGNNELTEYERDCVDASFLDIN